MKICLVSREYPPESGWGGIGTYTYCLAHALSNMGHELYVIAYAADKEAEYMDKKVHVHRIKEKEIKGLWRIEKFFPLSIILYSIRAARKINDLVRRYKIDIVESPEWGAEVFIYSFFRKTPLVIKFHTPMLLIQKFNSYPKTINIRLTCWLEKITSLRADLLTSPSKALAEIMAKTYKIEAGRITVVPNPIDEDIFVPPLRKDNDKSYVLYIGTLALLKGVHIIADAIVKVTLQCPGVDFIFIGRDTKSPPGYGSMRGYIRAKNPGNENIHFLDRLERYKLISYYQNASVCVVPSLWENLPYSCIEAMSCGTPVIGSNAGGIKEIISNGVNGILVEPGNSEALADAIIKVLRNRRFRQNAGRMARLHIENNFSKTRIANKTLEIYRLHLSAMKDREKWLNRKRLAL